MFILITTHGPVVYLQTANQPGAADSCTLNTHSLLFLSEGSEQTKWFQTYFSKASEKLYLFVETFHFTKMQINQLLHKEQIHVDSLSIWYVAACPLLS